MINGQKHLMPGRNKSSWGDWILNANFCSPWDVLRILFSSYESGSCGMTPIPPAILPPENLDNLGTWVSFPTPCVDVCVCVMVSHQCRIPVRASYLIPSHWSPTWTALRFLKPFGTWKSCGRLGGPGSANCKRIDVFSAWWLTHTQDWQSIWNFTSNKPGNFCRDTNGKDNLPSSVILFPDCRVSSISRLPEFVQSKACRKSIIRIHRKTSPV